MIKRGSYVEGFEQVLKISDDKAEKLNILKTRIVVEHIWKGKDGFRYLYGKVDDRWDGERYTTISDKFGEITLLNKEKPFTEKWWDIKERLIVSRREWRAFDIVQHFKGKRYRIVGVAVDTENNQEMVIYKDANNAGELLAKHRIDFESAVDMDKYKDSKQRWQFEKVK